MLALTALTDRIRRAFPEAEIRFREPMARHTTFRIGGPVSALFLPRGEEEATEILRASHELGIRPLILGNGSNLLFSDAPMDLIVVSLRGLKTIEEKGETVLVAGAGALLRSLAEAAAERSLTGLEFAHGIPGTVGGGVYMNAGAYGGEIRDIFVSARVLTPAGRIRVKSGEELDFSYRHSRLMESGETLLSATFRLQRGEESAIRERMAELMQKRMEKQPLDKPSGGSTFKRPKEGFAAAMIDGAGLKGYGFGGARVSEKHAGFVVNEGGATAEDVLKTMRGVIRRVEEVYGVTLEPELRLVGVEL